MIKNYIKIALRNLWKNKGFSAINIFGLAIGLATCLLIMLYVTDELEYDRYNKKAERIYRIHSDINFGGSSLRLAVTSDPMGATLKKDYPQVEEYTRLYASEGSKLIKKGNEYINEENIAYADSTFFRVFTLPAIQGNTFSALDEPNTIVVTASGAEKYFGKTDVIGKIIEVDKTPYKITAVIKDIPRTSHFNFDFLLSMKNADYGWGNFLSHNFHTYILLKKGTDYKAFEKNFTGYINKYILPQAKQLMHINSMEEFSKAGNKMNYTLMPLTHIHLHSDRFPELSVNSNIQYVYIFSAVALFVLLIACINFMNLSTARSASRAKEVGIRKVLGTERKSLVWQFLLESFITVVVALFIAIGMAIFALPMFNGVSGKSFATNDFFNGVMITFIIAIPFVVGLISGSYPAFFLSRFKPIVVLKGNASSLLKKSNLRSVLVVFQFATSIILIICTLVVYYQLKYIQSKNVGFNKDQVLVLGGTGAMGYSAAETFKDEVIALPEVSSGSFSGYLPVASSARNDNTFFKSATFDAREGINMQRWIIDYDYIKTLGMQMVQGRNFSKEYGSDSGKIIINETAAKLLGFPNPVGQTVYTFTNDNKPITFQVLGVVKNFNFESLHQDVGPLTLILGKNIWATSFKIQTKDISALLKKIKNKWRTIAPGMPFNYSFLDESFNQMYRSEQRVGKIAIVFAILAIVIACMGLFGLVTYAAERRTKEIGVRKVLGASVADIIAMLSKDFLKLVAIATIISFPVAWWAMHKWLQDFAYRIDISWWIFAIAALVAAAIALATVSFQAIRAAIANPVNSLRSE